MEEIRVLIVAADPLARAGLALLLQEAEHILIVGQIDREMLAWEEALEVYRPAAVLWDLGWDGEPDEAELEEMSQLNIPLLVLIPSDDLLSDILATGAQGVLLRKTEAKRLESAIQAIMQNLIALDPSFSDVLRPSSLSPSLGTTAEDAAVEPLTPRENEVLMLLSAGLTNKAIAQKLGISPHTVKFHVTAIMTKLSAQSRTEAVSKATRLGLLPL